MNPQQPQPFTNLMLIVTEACNLRCSHCYEARRGYDKTKTMSWQTARKTVDLFLAQVPPEIERTSITFFGGEPTLEFDLIKKVIDYTYDHRTLGSYTGERYNYVINTNGTLLSESMLNLYKQLGSKISIRVSVDGYAENQNVVRKMKGGQGSWERVKKNLLLYRALKENYGVRVNLITTINKNTYKNIYFDYTRLYEMAGLPIGFLFVHEEEWNEDDFAEIERQALNLHKWCIEHKMRFPLCDIRWRPHESDNICAAGVSSFAVNSAGDIYPCHRCYYYGTNETYRLGNVESGILHDKLALICALNCVDRLPKACQSCDPILRGRCHICFASNEKIYGNLYKVPPSFCALTKDLHQLLTEQERAFGCRQDTAQDEALRTMEDILFGLLRRDGSSKTRLK